MEGKFPLFLADLGSSDVGRLRVQLMQHGVEPVFVALPTNRMSVIFVCLTPGYEPPNWIYASSVKIVPLLFQGGVKSVLLADIKEANFGKDWGKAFSEVLRAIERLC